MAPSFIAPIDKDTPAAFIGTTRPCISLFMNKPGKPALSAATGTCTDPR